jgi:type IV secretory pathway VirB10-like protein
VSSNDPEREEGKKPEAPASCRARTEDDARPLTGEPVAPMRLRPEPPRVTRLSRKVLAGLGLPPASVVGGALIYALQTRHGGNQGQELYSTDNRTTPDGLAGLPKDYSGVPKLGPPLPGDLGRPILNAQNAGQPVPTPGMAMPFPVISTGRTTPGAGTGIGADGDGCSRSTETRPAANHRHDTAHGDLPQPISPASASRRSRRRPRRRIASSPSSTRRPTSAPSRPIVSPRPHRRMCFRPAP